MDISKLKEYIFENNKMVDILDNLNCHHIKDKGDYYTCGNPDGDNTTAITLYKNANLNVINYTRDITKGKSYNSDIITLVEFFKECSFFEAIKHICEWIELDIYHDFDKDIPESIKLTNLIFKLSKNDSINEKEKPLKQIPEKILTYYHKYVNDLFKNDNISYCTQQEFEIGYDDDTNRITIPIRDEFNNLIGVKGRLFSTELSDNELKYLYLEPCARSQILYGLNKTYNYIKSTGKVLVVESEKGVMQLWDMGVYNSVATGGKKISQNQIDKLIRLCCPIILCFDKDVLMDEINEIANRFIDGVEIYALIDTQNILNKKESPTDNPVKFNKLLNDCIIRIK